MAEVPALKPENQQAIDAIHVVTQFSKLYSKAIARLYDTSRHEFLGDVMRSLKEMRRLKPIVKHPSDIDFHFYIDINFHKPESRCAYLYAYSVINTTVVYSEFLKYLKGSQEKFLELFSKSSLKICCLAGGPAPEAVAISKAISGFLGRFRPDDASSPINVQVTIVDIYPEWESDAKAVLKTFNKSSEMFISKDVHCKVRFLTADLHKNFEKPLKNKIYEADIVTFVKFASAEQELTLGAISVTSMMQRITDCMSEDSCLFMLDTAGGNAFHELVKVISRQKSSFKLQQSLHKRYRLYPETLEAMNNVMNFKSCSDRIKLLPTVLTRISSCIWIKKSKRVQKTVVTDDPSIAPIKKTVVIGSPTIAPTKKTKKKSKEHGIATVVTGDPPIAPPKKTKKKSKKLGIAGNDNPKKL